MRIEKEELDWHVAVIIEGKLRIVAVTTGKHAQVLVDALKECGEDAIAFLYEAEV